jgi:hypothetical protein
MELPFYAEKQNKDENIRLLEASSVAYKEAKKWEIVITVTILVLAIGYSASFLFFKGSVLFLTNIDFKLCLSIVSFILTILIQVFSGKLKGDTAKGAILKEQFDISVFNLPYKSTIKEIESREIIRLFNEYNGDKIKNWYSPNISVSIPENTIVAILQYTNTNWDIQLRKKYTNAVKIFLAVYSVIIILLLIILKTDLLTSFLLVSSLTSFYTHFIGVIRGNDSAIKKRKAISSGLDKDILMKKSFDKQRLRDFQDEIYSTRQESAKVPDFFFRKYKDQLNQETEAYIDIVNKVYV